ncbi:mycobactin polyketide synthase MbtD [Mycobacterium noviomagense]|uniref:Polyketide synthase n=1 Tax=Mycobacterium noviomagense TaxID=459858 RepID=A0A7I7P7B4_9MYCO|nr:mycobactin polyketide synthase MbtD [Mycobacterium noviomagense]ORB18815.1 polyketide synthase [Mycobacterium noviomagense]BBY04757.1 polyketide synthase [Mycobacterium noviomagense]
MSVHSLPDGRIPVLLSAHDEELVARDAAAVLEYLDREPSVAAVAATLLRIRRVRRHRAVIRAADRAELAAGLRALADGHEHPLVATSSLTDRPRVAFVCPGQGNQWPSMGAEAYRQLPAYRAEADNCAAAFVAAGHPSPLPYLVDGTARHWSQTEIQGAQFTHCVSLAQVWRSYGILPAITVGHSLGEVAAAYGAGAMTLADAVAVVAARATVVDRLAGPYGMAVVGVAVDEAKRLISETAGWLEISAVNAPSSTVVSGDRGAVEGLVRLAEQTGIFARAIDVDYPGHTSALEPLRGVFEELLPRSAFLDAPVQFVSSACGKVVGTDIEFGDYWCANLCRTVRFDQSVAVAAEHGANAFVELSAHPSLLSSLADLVKDESAVIVGSGRRDQPVAEQLSANLAAMAVADRGYRWVDVAGVDGHSPLPGFPNAPMKAVHLWARREPLPSAPGSVVTVADEEWHPYALSRASHDGPRRIAIVEPAFAETPLPQRLVEAIAAHPDCELTDPDEAEIAVVIAPALMDPDATVAVTHMVCQPHPTLPRYAGLVGPRCRSVWLVTAGAEQVAAGDPAGLPAQAALAAMHRSVGFEFPDQRFAHVDLPCWEISPDIAPASVDVLLGDALEVAVRDSGCYVRTLRERDASERPLDAAALDNVVITGGNGVIGRHYARYCIEHGARSVTLLSRKGVSSDELDRLAGEHAVALHTPICDVTNPKVLSAVAAEYAGDGASLLVHAAGTATFAPHDRLTGADLETVFGAKVIGLARMVQQWPLRENARILLCSSVSGLWGGYGHAAYAAANRMLDVLAGQLRAKGLDCTAIRWGLWQGTTIGGPGEIARIERSGLVAINPDAAIVASLRDDRGDPLILAADFDRLQVFFETNSMPTSFTAASSKAQPVPESNATAGRPVDEVVRTELAAALSVSDAGSVDLGVALVDLGIDSLLALDLRKRLRRLTGCSVPLARLLGGITGSELVEALRQPAPPPPRAEVTRAERVDSTRD